VQCNFSLIAIHGHSYTNTIVIKQIQHIFLPVLNFNTRNMNRFNIFLVITMIVAIADGNSDKTNTTTLCKCPSAVNYPKVKRVKLPFCAYELGANCLPMQQMFFCEGPSSLPILTRRNCMHQSNGLYGRFCISPKDDYEGRYCGDRFGCNKGNEDCGRNLTTDFIYLNYGKYVKPFLKSSLLLRTSFIFRLAVFHRLSAF
jgi:hypothetical protein